MKLVKLGSTKVFVISGFIVILVLVFAAMSFESHDTLKVNPFVPAVMEEARYSRVDAVGDMGGMPVTIPRHFANFVEYDLLNMKVIPVGANVRGLFLCVIIIPNWSALVLM